MIVPLFAFLLAASIAAAATPASRWLALRWGAVDRPNARKVHHGVMPRMGGMAIVLAFMLPTTGLFFVEWQSLAADALMLSALLAGGLIIAILGMVDDLHELAARHKFMVQFVIAALAWGAGFRFENLGLPFLGSVVFPVWLDFIISVLWIAGVINAINLIDGLDGLAAGVTFLVAATNLVLSLQSGNVLGAFIAATIAGAVVGFLLFNWNPAIVFMGDTGSMFLGFVLATTSMMTSQKTSTAVAMLVPIVALGVPVMDTLLSMVRRFLERRPLFSPDKGHLHHRLLRAGFTQRRAVLAIYGLCVVFAGTAIAMTAAQDAKAAVALGVLVVLVVGIVRFFGFFNMSNAVRGVMQRSVFLNKLIEARRELNGTLGGQADSLEQVFEQVVLLGRRCGYKAVGWKSVGLRPALKAAELLMDPESTQYRKAATKGFRIARASGLVGRAAYIELKIVFPARMGEITPEGNTVLHALADQVGAALERLRVKGALPCKDDCLEPGVMAAANPPAQVKGGASAQKNQALDPLWEHFVSLCAEDGFLAAEWNTVGLSPHDKRRASFGPEPNAANRAVMKHSVPITSLSFLELQFVYQGKTGNKTPREIRQAVVRIGDQILPAMGEVRKAM